HVILGTSSPFFSSLLQSEVFLIKLCSKSVYLGLFLRGEDTCCTHLVQCLLNKRMFDLCVRDGKLRCRQARRTLLCRRCTPQLVCQVRRQGFKTAHGDSFLHQFNSPVEVVGEWRCWPRSD